MRLCARPGCNNPLNTGSTYCSRSCAALDRKRKSQFDSLRAKLSQKALDIVDSRVVGTLVSKMGQEAIPVIEEMAVTLQEDKLQTPPLLSNLTVGEEFDNYYYGIITGKNESYRPGDALSYDRIEDMLRNGQVIFGLEMKKSWIRTALRDSRSWAIECNDERMEEIVDGVMSTVLSRHAGDFLWSLPYGTFFGEKVFDRQPAFHWGLEGNEKIIGYKKIRPVYPRSVEKVNYTDDLKFDGYTQRKSHSRVGAPTVHYGDEIVVPRDLAFVLTYDKRWRNVWGNSILEAVYPFWAWYEIAYRSWLRYLERMGTPVTVCYAPQRGQIRQPDGTLMRTMKYAFLVAGNVAKSNAIAVPSDVDPDTNQRLWEIKYLADDKRAVQFQDAIKELGAQIIRSLIIGERSIEQPGGGSGGGYNAAEMHFAVTMLHNEHVLSEFISQINDFLIPQIVEYNGTASTPPARMITEGLDMEEKARLFQLLNTMGNQADQHSMKYIDWKAIMKINNIPLLSDEDVEKLDEEALKRQEDQMKMASQFEQPQLPKTPGSSEKKAPTPPAPLGEKVKASSDYVLWQLANGMQPQILLSDEQAHEMVDRLSERPFTIQLYNPYHDEYGRFASKESAKSTSGIPAAYTAPRDITIGGRRLFKKKTPKEERAENAFVPKGADIAMTFTKTAAISGTIAAIASFGKKIIPQQYHEVLDAGISAAKLVGAGAGALAGGAWALIHGRLSLKHAKDFLVESRREVTYKGKNKKALFQRFGELFDHGRKAIGWGATSIAGVAGAITLGATFYSMVTGKKTFVNGIVDKLKAATGGAEGFVGEGWFGNILSSLGLGNVLNIIGGIGLEETNVDPQEIVDNLALIWLMSEDAISDGTDLDLGGIVIGQEELQEFSDSIFAFLVGLGTDVALESVELYNPYHDEYGRFASKDRAKTTSERPSWMQEPKYDGMYDQIFPPTATEKVLGKAAGVLRAVGWASFASMIASKIAVVASERIRRKKGRSEDENIIEFDVRGKTYSMTHKTFEQGASKIAKYSATTTLVSRVLSLASGIASLGLYLSRLRKGEEELFGAFSDYFSRRFTGQPATKQWPEGADDAKFNSMYKKLAKAFHPDVSTHENAAEVMSEINQAHDRRDWHTLADLFKKEFGTEPTELEEEDIGKYDDLVDAYSVLQTVISEDLDAGVEYFEFEPDGPITTPFVEIDGRAYLDAQSMQLIWAAIRVSAEILKADTKMEEDEFPFVVGTPSVSLFNPYHDELGRFTNKQGGSAVSWIKDNAQYNGGGDESWIEKHKKALLIGGTAALIATGVVLTIIAVKSGAAKGVSTANVKSDGWSGRLSVFSGKMSTNVDPEKAARLQKAASVSMSALGKLGIDTSRVEEITFVGIEDFGATGGGEAHLTGSTIEIGSKVANRILGQGDFWDGIRVLTHELFHSRIKGGSTSVPRNMLDVEEGLTDLVSKIATSSIRFNDFSWGNNAVLEHALTMRGSYIIQQGNVLRAAYKVAERSGKTVLDVIKRWATEAAEGTWTEIASEIISESFLESDVSLYNPYHDELGRFTTSKGAPTRSLKDIVYDGFEDVKEWAEEHKKALLIGAGALTAAGITALAVSRLKQGDLDKIRLLVKGKWSGNVDAVAKITSSSSTPKHLDMRVYPEPSVIAGLHTKTSIAMNEGSKYVDLSKVNGVVFHTSDSAWNIDLAEKPNILGTVWQENIAHISPETTVRVLRGEDRGLMTLDHEIFHMRNGLQDFWHEGMKKFTSTSQVKLRRAEEGLATIYEVFMNGVRNNGLIGSKDTDAILRSYTNASDVLEKQINSNYLRWKHAVGTTLFDMANTAYLGFGGSLNTIWHSRLMWAFSGDPENVLVKIVNRMDAKKWVSLLESIELANPYHDVAGQFTTQSQAVRISKKVNELAGRINKRLDGVKGNVKVEIYKNNAQVKKALGSFQKDGVAAYFEGKIHITPHGQKLFEKYPEFVDYALAHELVHSRKRAAGAGIYYKNQIPFEEGATDLMTAAILRKPNMIAYKSYAASIATLARSASGNDRRKAWGIISETHRNAHVVELPGGSWEDVEWLMQSVPRKLEEDKEPEWMSEWRKSEDAKHEYLVKARDGGKQDSDKRPMDTESGD